MSRRSSLPSRPFIATSVKLGLSAVLLGLSAAPALGNGRSLTYTYESATLPAGARELELWTTARLGRDAEGFRRYDQRIEIESGLTDRLMGAFYINAETQRTAAAGSVSALTGISLEFKYRHLDAAADALGLASYLELSNGPDESELEAKLILDKDMDGWLWALNLVVEEEVEDLGGENELEHGFGLVFGSAFELGEHAALGLEVRGTGVVAEGELESFAVYAGPTLSLKQKAGWLALTVAPQIGAFGTPAGGFGRDLEHNEKVQARLLVGYDF